MLSQRSEKVFPRVPASTLAMNPKEYRPREWKGHSFSYLDYVLFRCLQISWTVLTLSFTKSIAIILLKNDARLKLQLSPKLNNRWIKCLIYDAQKFIGLQITDNAVGIALLLIRAEKKNRGPIKLNCLNKAWSVGEFCVISACTSRTCDKAARTLGSAAKRPCAYPGLSLDRPRYRKEWAASARYRA